jgi:hypothetical protein
MGLEPVLLAQLSEYERWEDAEMKGSWIAWNAVHATIPVRRAGLCLIILRLGKNKVGQLIRTRAKK